MATETPPRIFARGELAAAGWAVALLVSMSALKWFGVDGIPGRTPSVVSAVDAWHGLTVLSWLMLLTALIAIGSVALHFGQRRHGAKTDTSLLLAGASTLTAGLVAYRVLIHLPAPQSVVDQKLGALVGLACALGLAASTWMALRDGRSGGPARRAPTRSDPHGA